MGKEEEGRRGGVAGRGGGGGAGDDKAMMTTLCLQAGSNFFVSSGCVLCFSPLFKLGLGLIWPCHRFVNGVATTA